MALVALRALKPLWLKQKKTDRSLELSCRREGRVISNAQVALEPYDGQRIGLRGNHGNDCLR
jgi:hypothetical protein